MQRIELIGHIGQDAEVKDFNDNQVINFSVAVTESYTNKQGEKISNTTWYECAKWGNNTSVAQYLKKGTKVFVSGKPQSRAQQKENGTLVSNLGVNVFNLTLLGSKNENQNQSQSQPQASNNAQVQAPATNLNEEDDDNGLPF
jgi:single-strand DNA-binding protein